MFAYGDKGYENCESIFCDRQNPDLKDGNLQWIDSKNWDVDLLLTLLSMNTTSVYGSLKTVVPWLFWNNTGLHNQLRGGAPTEDAAMLNVSERAQRLMYTLYSEELRKAEQPLMHLSDALLAWLSQFYDWKKRKKLSSQLPGQGQKRII